MYAWGGYYSPRDNAHQGRWMQRSRRRLFSADSERARPLPEWAPVSAKFADGFAFSLTVVGFAAAWRSAAAEVYMSTSDRGSAGRSAARGFAVLISDVGSVAGGASPNRQR